MTGTVRIGCSGWIYRHWRKLFYPAKLPQRLWFAHYAASFNNDIYGHAIDDALTLRAMVGQASR